MFVLGKQHLIAAAALALTTLGTGGAQAQFGRQRSYGYESRRPTSVYVSNRHERIDSMARRLERDARALNRETDAHFRNSRDYRIFESQVDEMVRLADHIHDVAHRGGSLHHLRDDVARLSRLQQSSERLFDSMALGCRLDRDTIRHVRGALNRVENDIAVLRGELY